MQLRQVFLEKTKRHYSFLAKLYFIKKQQSLTGRNTFAGKSLHLRYYPIYVKIISKKWYVFGLPLKINFKHFFKRLSKMMHGGRLPYLTGSTQQYRLVIRSLCPLLQICIDNSFIVHFYIAISFLQR